MTNITPDKISKALNFIANNIDGSSKPSINLVASDLKYVISALENPSNPRLADSNEKLAEILWKSEEGKDVDRAYGIAKKAPLEEKLLPALKGLKNSIDDFVKSLKGEKTTRQEIEDSDDVYTSAPKTR